MFDDEAATISQMVNTTNMNISLDTFQQGLQVKLGHRTIFEDANAINKHSILTDKIVLTHLKGTMDYYKRIEVVEIEGDLHEAVLSKNLDRVESKFKKLVEAQKILNKSISDQLSQEL